MPYRAVWIEDTNKHHHILTKLHLGLDTPVIDSPGIPDMPGIGIPEFQLLGMDAIQFIATHEEKPCSPQGLVSEMAFDWPPELCLAPEALHPQGSRWRFVDTQCHKFYLDAGGYNSEPCKAKRTRTEGSSVGHDRIQ